MYKWVVLKILPLIITFQNSVFSQTDNDKIYYVSLNEAIQEGQLEGVATVKEVKAHGDFGVGSEERLASELVLLKGIAYGIPWNGVASPLKDKTLLAYAAVKFFKKDTIIVINKKTDFQELQQILSIIIGPNSFAAIKISSRFTNVEYRSYKKQERPFTPTKEARADTMQKKNIEGTLVGFFTPKAAQVLNSPSFHFHFLNASKTTGGHVIDAEMEVGSIEIDFAKGLEVILPSASQMKGLDLNKKLSD